MSPAGARGPLFNRACKPGAIVLPVVPDKPWKADAIMRLLLSVFVCFFAGSFALAATNVGPALAIRVKVYALAGSAVVCLAVTLWLLSKPWRAGEGLKRAAILTGIFYVGLVLGGWAANTAGPIQPSLTQMIISALSLQGALLILLGPFLREHQTTWAEAFSLGRRRLMASTAGFLLACAFAPIAWTLQNISAWLMTKAHLAPKLQQVVQTLQSDNAATGHVAFGLITVVIVPVAEEAFFRGILFSWIKSLGYRRLALWGTSLLFAAVHGNMVGFIPLMLLAVALALLYEATGNLLAPITAHAVFNAANLVRFYWLDQAMHP